MPDDDDDAVYNAYAHIDMYVYMYVCMCGLYLPAPLSALSLYQQPEGVWTYEYYCCSMGVDSLVVPVLTPMVDIYFCII